MVHHRPHAGLCGRRAILQQRPRQREVKIIEAEKRIKFTWENAQHGPGSSVTVLFESKGPEKCVVRLSHERLASVADADDLKGGWSWAMDSLKSYLETGRPIPHYEWVKAQKP